MKEERFVKKVRTGHKDFITATNSNACDEYTKKLVADLGENGLEFDEDVLKKAAAAIRFANPICWTCRKIGHGPRKEVDLKRCSGCHFYYYCSYECQKADWKKRHKYECKAANK